MTSTTSPRPTTDRTERTTDLPRTRPTSKDRTMSPDPRHLIRTILTATATFLGLLLLTALWTVHGPSYDAQAAPLTASGPCPAGEATGGTCGTEGALTGPDATTPTDTPSQATEAPARRCKGCRLSQEEHDARQADKQAAHDRAEARRQRGAERRAEAQRRREERAARRSSRPSPAASSRSHASSASESPSSSPAAQDGTSTPAYTSSASEDAPETLSDAPTSDDTAPSDTGAPAASAPYTPLEIPEASRRPAPYDASKDPFEVRREAARQAADAVNRTADRARVPTATASSPSPASTSSSGSWAEQLPTWALCLTGLLAASGLIVYKVSRPRSRLSDHSDLLGDRRS